MQLCMCVCGGGCGGNYYLVLEETKSNIGGKGADRHGVPGEQHQNIRHGEDSPVTLKGKHKSRSCKNKTTEKLPKPKVLQNQWTMKGMSWCKNSAVMFLSS